MSFSLYFPEQPKFPAFSSFPCIFPVCINPVNETEKHHTKNVKKLKKGET